VKNPLLAHPFVKVDGVSFASFFFSFFLSFYLSFFFFLFFFLFFFCPVLKPIAYVRHRNLFITAARVKTRRLLCVSLGGKILLTCIQEVLRSVIFSG
jgi:hypothetical protein